VICHLGKSTWGNNSVFLRCTNQGECQEIFWLYPILKVDDVSSIHQLFKHELFIRFIYIDSLVAKVH